MQVDLQLFPTATSPVESSSARAKYGEGRESGAQVASTSEQSLWQRWTDGASRKRQTMGEERRGGVWMRPLGNGREGPGRAVPAPPLTPLACFGVQ